MGKNKLIGLAVVAGILMVANKSKADTAKDTAAVQDLTGSLGRLSVTIKAQQFICIRQSVVDPSLPIGSYIVPLSNENRVYNASEVYQITGYYAFDEWYLTNVATGKIRQLGTANRLTVVIPL